MPHADILEQSDSLRRPLLASAIFHVSFLGLATIYTFWMAHVSHENSWGSVAPGGGAVEVSAVKSIPIPGRTGRVNPLANDTESQIPEPPPEKKAEKRQPKPDLNEIPLWKEKPIRDQQQTVARRNLPPQQYRENQLYSTLGQAANNPMYNMPHGGGSIGVGAGVFGQQYGWYASLIAQRIGEKWLTGGLDPRAQSTPAVVSFQIRRDGSVNTPVVMQSSGNYNIDSSAQRAVVMAAPFPPLPAGYNGDTAGVEIRFNLR
ncbi:MAG TPA: TonB family protein [Bryobacteraceae bacterium]|nr:TonB family protein [Bryobacteraceae bacterium]